MLVRITDPDTTEAIEVDGNDISSTVTPWLEDDPETTDVIAALQHAVLTDDHAAAAECQAYLGITVERLT